MSNGTIDGRRRRAQEGSAMVELAIVLPALTLLLFGVADVGRMVAQSSELQYAAECGTQYASSDLSRAGDTAGAQAAALADIPDLKGAVATASQYCTCSYGQPLDCSTSCTDRRAYLKVVVQYTYQNMVPIPGLPLSPVLSGTSIVRLQ